MPNILLGVSGSVAAIKLPLLCKALKELGDVKIVTTSTAKHFTQSSALPEDIPVHTDEQEWSTWQKMGDAVLHIELRRWADILVIAPLSANTLAKLACGLSDNLLTCVVRAWDWEHRPVVVAPAMNTLMWESPFTTQHLQKLLGLGAVVVPPISKTLACGDVGLGAMASPEAIAVVVKAVLESVPAAELPHGALRIQSCNVDSKNGPQRDTVLRQLHKGVHKARFSSFIRSSKASYALLIALSLLAGLGIGRSVLPIWRCAR